MTPSVFRCAQDTSPAGVGGGSIPSHLIDRGRGRERSRLISLIDVGGGSHPMSGDSSPVQPRLIPRGESSGVDVCE